MQRFYSRKLHEREGEFRYSPEGTEARLVRDNDECQAELRHNWSEAISKLAEDKRRITTDAARIVKSSMDDFGP